MNLIAGITQHVLSGSYARRLWMSHNEFRRNCSENEEEDIFFINYNTVLNWISGVNGTRYRYNNRPAPYSLHYQGNRFTKFFPEFFFNKKTTKSCIHSSSLLMKINFHCGKFFKCWKQKKKKKYFDSLFIFSAPFVRQQKNCRLINTPPHSIVHFMFCFIWVGVWLCIWEREFMCELNTAWLILLLLCGFSHCYCFFEYEEEETTYFNIIVASRHTHTYTLIFIRYVYTSLHFPFLLLFSFALQFLIVFLFFFFKRFISVVVFVTTFALSILGEMLKKLWKNISHFVAVL